MRLNDSAIEWGDVILLPSKPSDKVRFTVNASFELEPTLGNGEALYSSETCVEELVGGTYLITFPPRELGIAAPHPSLLITLGRWYSNTLAVAPSSDDSNLDSEGSSLFVRETNLGQEALVRYYSDYQREDLENAVQYFECARRNCPLTHPCYAATLVNLANAKLMSYRIHPRSTNLDELIRLYQEALNLRRPRHPDRPVTLLQLARALLLRYEQQECTESVADEIEKLMAEEVFSEDTHERRAADLVLDTLKRCRVVNSGSLVKLNELLRKLEGNAMPPDGYFDKPQRLINISTTLWKRYEKLGNLGDLDRLLVTNEEALRLLPRRHPDRLPCLRTLSAVLWRLFEIHGDFDYLRQSILLSDEALQFALEGHPEHRYWVINSTSHLAEMSERLGDIAFEASEYDESMAQYSQAIESLSSLVTHKS
ncbi:hypothetical protein EV363DRAFT_1399009 [Boletus edulis]|nr:hypothetical protein EV363DRAFT_1399009 [Boletus edulis]